MKVKKPENGFASMLDAAIQGSGGGANFTNIGEKSKMVAWMEGAILSMAATGELIRMMNYVDDIGATLRRIQTGIATMTAEERKRLADYMRHSNPSYAEMMESLEAS